MRLASGPNVLEQGLCDVDYDTVHLAVQVIDGQLTPENIRAYKAHPGHLGVEISLEQPALIALYGNPVWLYLLRQYYVRAGWSHVRITESRTLILEN